MKQVGIFFGTDSGTTRLIAKKIAKNLKQRLGDDAVAKPININRVGIDDLLGFDSLILGTPTYGKGVLPGKPNRNTEESWFEFLPQLTAADLSGRTVALYGLGDQESYPEHFVDGLRDLYDVVTASGAEVIGAWDVGDYEFETSRAVIDGHFVGLVLDQHLQHLKTDERIDAWLDQIADDLCAGVVTPVRANA